MLNLHVASRFKRSYRKMPACIKEDFGEKIERFKTHPFDTILGTHKLHGNLVDYFAFRLRDGYRVFFEFEGGNDVLLVNIGSHDDYSKWSRG
ncbi:MAG: hypothetical protein AAB666_02840 [Patescibacteria group bacterium]